MNRSCSVSSNVGSSGMAVAAVGTRAPPGRPLRSRRRAWVGADRQVIEVVDASARLGGHDRGADDAGVVALEAGGDDRRPPLESRDELVGVLADPASG